MADAAGRAAAMGTLEQLLAQPDLWAEQPQSLDPSQDGVTAASFGGSTWAAAMAQLAAKACTYHRMQILERLCEAALLSVHASLTSCTGTPQTSAPAVSCCASTSAVMLLLR